jgi:ABC-type transporter Mla subunit MlaD
MATRKEKVNAGLFLLIGVLLISLTIAVVAGLNLRQPGVPYTIRISKSVGGLREGSVVRYLGVPVGRVKDVDFPKNGGEVVLVEIEITKASTPIRAGTYATLASNFLTGETSIELLGGSDDGARLLPESIINWRPTTLMRLEDSLPGVLDELKKVVIDVHELFGSDNQTRIAKLIDDVDAAVLELHSRIEPMARDVQDVKERLALSSESIADSAAGLRREQSPTRKNLKKIEEHRLPSGKKLLKVSLLADWTWGQVWEYTAKNRIRYLPQYDRGYLSIGCEPCTEIPDDPKKPRSGRWGGSRSRPSPRWRRT